MIQGTHSAEEKSKAENRLSNNMSIILTIKKLSGSWGEKAGTRIHGDGKAYTNGVLRTLLMKDSNGKLKVSVVQKLGY